MHIFSRRCRQKWQTDWIWNGMRKEVEMMSERVMDRQGRWRNKTVAFRVSPEEDEVLETAVKLSGLTKQDYIIRRLQKRDIVVQGNPKVYKALKDEMKKILTELQRIQDASEVNADLMEVIGLVAETMRGMKEDSDWSNAGKKESPDSGNC